MISNKKIAIYGFGKEGISAAEYFLKQNNVFIIDDKNERQFEREKIDNFLSRNIKFYFGGNVPENEKFDILIRSPGVNPKNKNFQSVLKKAGNKSTSSAQIFLDNCPAKTIGVTGTKGKGTTSTLIQAILKQKYKQVFLAGNIGTPMLDVLPKLTQDSIAVLELSSFQLIDLKKSPNVAVVLMITSEHLDWHLSQKEYEGAKRNIVGSQDMKDYAVINLDFKISKSFAKNTKSKVYFFSTRQKTNGVYVKYNKIYSSIKKREEILRVDEILIPGKHNIQNVCAAIAAVKIFNVEKQKIRKVIKSFKGLEHRLQQVRILNGIKFYNDSFSTTPETTIAAIEAFQEPKILVLGGSSKNSDFSNLAKTIKNHTEIKAIILIGTEAHRIKANLKKFNVLEPLFIEGLKDMKSIVKKSSEISQEGDIVLFSPACASFDMFKNYKDRGEQFIKEVLSLQSLI